MGKKRKGQKSPNGSGSVWRRPDGRYSAALTYPYHDPETGRTKRKRLTTTKRSWESAHRWLLEKQGSLLGGAVMSPENPTLREYFATWLSDVVETSVARNTYLKREYAVRVHLSPALGHFKLSELEPRSIQTLYSRLARTYSLATCKEIHITLNMALGQAVRWGILGRNPVDLVASPKADRRAAFHEEDEDEGEVRALTDDQAQRLFRASENSRWHHYFVTAIRTGLRPGELLGLRWGDLNLDADPGSLKVRRTLDTHSQPRFNPPKSAASRRTVSLHWEAQDALLAQRMMLAEEGLPTGSKALVFPSATGTPMNAGNLRKRHLHRYLGEDGLPAMTLHELRHTFASIMLYEWRVPLEIVAEMMGHESPAITLRLYAHFVPGSQEAAIKALRKMHQRPKRVAG